MTTFPASFGSLASAVDKQRFDWLAVKLVNRPVIVAVDKMVIHETLSFMPFQLIPSRLVVKNI